MDIKSILQQFGLNNRKADVYLAALELGAGTTIEIAKKAGIKRTTCYDVLMDLKMDNLIYETTLESKRLFVAEDPGKIKKELQRKEAVFSEILPMLQSIYNVKGVKPKIRFYEGVEGLKEVYSDTLSYQGEILAIGSEDIVTVVGLDWILDYVKKRVKKGIHVRGIVGRTQLLAQEIIAKDQQHLRTTKIIDPKKYPFPIEINIYGHQKIFLVSARDRVAVIIEGAEIFRAMKSFFELLWDNLPEVRK